ncbi:MAG: ABC transporter substrate-binding protein [Xanthobacteraceae bacterium]|nr:ABC transporter substrate-binding protein [Xanthobacteraceae bacterium]
MRLFRFTSVPAMAFAAAALAVVAGPAHAQTKIAIGKVVGGNGLHIPSYVADAAGIFKQEGLEARFVSLTGKAQVTAGMSGNLDFVPIPSGGAQAALNGAEIRYIVGQSMSSQWVFVTRGDITRVEDLKGKTIGYGRLGSADYDEGATFLGRFFNMQVGKDYKVIAYQGEPERIPALLNKDIDATMVSAAHAAQAVAMGMKVIARTSDKMPRVGGTFWTMKGYAEKNPETVKRFTRAIAKAVMYIRTNKDGSMKAIKEHLGLTDDKTVAAIWDELHNVFGAELPPALFREIFESRRLDMIAENQWPKDKPLPDPEQFLLRAQLEAVLKEVNYVPAKVGTN